MFHLNKKVFIIFLFFLIFNFKVYALVKPTPDFYVNDYANVLSKETKKYIIDKSVKLNSVDGTQIVVVTINNLEGKSIEEYAYELFNYFKIGDSIKDNGLLLLLSIEDRMFRVEVGNGLEGILPDGKTGRFQDEYIIPYFKNNEWDKGIKNGYDVFYTEIVKLNNLNLEYDNYIDNKNNSVGIEFFYYFLSFLSGFVVAYFLRNSGIKTSYSIIIFIIYCTNYSINLLFHLIGYILLLISLNVKSNKSGNNNYNRRYGSGSGRSIGGFSGRGSIGGGGSSSGGGSSRSF